MPKAQPPPDTPDKAEEGVDPRTALERFRNLAKGLLNVPRDELEAIERQDHPAKRDRAHRNR